MSLRKLPGSTMVTWTPSGASSRCSASDKPSKCKAASVPLSATCMHAKRAGRHRARRSLPGIRQHRARLLPSPPALSVSAAPKRPRHAAHPHLLRLVPKWSRDRCLLRYYATGSTRAGGLLRALTARNARHMSQVSPSRRLPAGGGRDDTGLARRSRPRHASPV
jgi:hypothetical protein